MSAAIDDGGPAFPGEEDQWKRSPFGANFEERKVLVKFSGMKLRDWFAGQALAGGYGLNVANGAIGTQAYAIADAMIEARKQGTK